MSVSTVDGFQVREAAVLAHCSMRQSAGQLILLAAGPRGRLHDHKHSGQQFAWQGFEVCRGSAACECDPDASQAVRITLLLLLLPLLKLC